MAKAILISIKPQWVSKILNGEKTIEIRKKFPSDYVGWVYIYCTKENDLFKSYIRMGYYTTRSTADNLEYNGKGKIVARFWCDKVEEHRPFFHWCIEKETCLIRDDVLDYLDSKDKFVGNPKRQDKVYAIYITKLEIFDEPKGLWQFKTPKNAKRYKHDLEQAYKDDYEIGTRIAEGIANDDECANCVELTEMSEGYYGLNRAPQSWCFVEI